MSPDFTVPSGICPACGCPDGEILEFCERVPLLQNRLHASFAEARQASVGTLAMTLCPNCSFVWNDRYDRTIQIYDQAYENNQAESSYFRDHLLTRAQRVIAALSVSEGWDLVEVGCGQGEFLRQLLETGPSHVDRIFGFDPAWRGHVSGVLSRANVIADYFDACSAQTLHIGPAAIVSRHTIEHIPDPLAFLKNIRHSTSSNASLQLFLETPCVNWIINNYQFQDFFYEHCSLFNSTSIYHILIRAGFQPKCIEQVFGGQYLWAEAVTEGSPCEPPPQHPLQFRRWSELREQFVLEWREKIATCREHGPVFVWGAGAKGVTFCRLVDERGEAITALVDINPKKQGLYTPMTGTPVIGPDELPPERFTAIVMNPNYHDEIDAQLTKLGRHGSLLSVVNGR